MIDFGLIQEDARKIWRFLRQDLKDDWFQDPLLFTDRDLCDFTTYFRDNVSRHCGVFLPTDRELLDIPKGQGALRYSLETNIYDRIAYHAFGVTLIDYFDRLIDRRVFSHRLDEVNLGKRNRKYLFLNAIDQWKKFEEFVKIDAKDQTVLLTDVQNYYENIRISDLRSTLLDCLRRIELPGPVKARLRFCIDSLSECLLAWSFNGTTGLPQNRDISSFLANVYMLPVDRFMIGKGYDYYRYMDDIRVLCNGRYSARQALKDLVGELRKLGLNTNSAKTSILEPNTPDHSRFLSKDSYQLEMIDSMLNSKKKPIVAKAFALAKEQFVELIAQHDFSSRRFRFFNSRICKFALCRDIAKPPSFFDYITTGVINGLYENPEVSDQFYLYLSSVDLNMVQLGDIEAFLINNTVAIYEWQNYLLWKLLVLKQYRSKRLLQHATRLLKNGESIADRAGAILYIGAFAGEKGKRILAAKFKTFSNFLLQRHALIALQCAPFKEIRKSIEEHLRPESIGILRKLKHMKEPCFVKAPDPIRYSDLIREVSFYV
jgi:hypothetical protein